MYPIFRLTKELFYARRASRLSILEPHVGFHLEDRDRAPSEVLRALGQPQDSPPLPGWIGDWIAAEARRPWPPQR